MLETLTCIPAADAVQRAWAGLLRGPAVCRQQRRTGLCQSAGGEGGRGGLLKADKCRQCGVHHPLADRQAFPQGKHLTLVAAWHCWPQVPGRREPAGGQCCRLADCFTRHAAVCTGLCCSARARPLHSTAFFRGASRIPQPPYQPLPTQHARYDHKLSCPCRSTRTTAPSVAAAQWDSGGKTWRISISGSTSR